MSELKFSCDFNPGNCRICDAPINDKTNSIDFVQMCDACFLRLKFSLLKLLREIERLAEWRTPKMIHKNRACDTEEAHKSGYKLGYHLVMDQVKCIYREFLNVLIHAKEIYKQMQANGSKQDQSNAGLSDAGAPVN